MLGESNIGAHSRLQEEYQEHQQGADSRILYLRKMYALVFIQLISAAGICHLAIINQGFADWIETYVGFTFWAALVILVGIQLSVLFVRQSVSKAPLNIVFYILHVVCFAFVFANFEIGGDGEMLTHGLYFFSLVIFSLLIHVLFAKNEITFQSVALYVLGAVYLATLYSEIFIPDLQGKSLYILSIITVLWGFYNVWENETIVGSRNEWSTACPFIGAVSVYLNIFSLFLRLVDLIQSLIVKARA
ncbi:hypothetical protein PPERSA_10908 [Pseudocohnilembus persalinus]|uniref:Uncharacterized protein n=1 Tax=Pseudocohnilembus persalinus TaxID=266149 RepID=A0A0V0RA30_PSEPJ|nr:hypothetical protein PPERSA_10908 [Pseudocohnilembus persalinus]|eukprot:KRX11141.1 hypothetical protein PPERSA_10908 [Pseudocohnilembus persalinus]